MSGRKRLDKPKGTIVVDQTLDRLETETDEVEREAIGKKKTGREENEKLCNLQPILTLVLPKRGRVAGEPRA